MTLRVEYNSYDKVIRGYSSAGRAPALQAGGHRFDPDTLHQVECFAFDRYVAVVCAANDENILRS